MLEKRGIDIPFAQGLDTKTDPKRVQIGQFVKLKNTVFNKGELLQKRNGYAKLSSLPSTSYSYLNTFNGNLTAFGSNIAAYNSANETWVSKGSITPLSVSTLSLLRNNLNQTLCESAISSNGLVCTAYIESDGSTSTNKFVVADSTTGQNIVAPTAIPVSSGTVSGGMRVFVLGGNFVIVFTNTITAVTHLQYITVNTHNPTLVGSNTDIAASYAAPTATTLAWDGFVANNFLYLAYNTTSGGQAIKTAGLSPGLVLSVGKTFTAYIGTIVSLTADVTSLTATIYLTFYDNNTQNGYTAVLDNNLNLIANPVQTITGEAIVNIVSAAQNGTVTAFREVTNAYTYDSSIPSNFIRGYTLTPLVTSFKSVFSSGAGTITVNSATGLVNGMSIVDNTTAANIQAGTTFTVSGTTLTLSHTAGGNSASNPGDTLTAATVTNLGVVIRSVGLASKAFIVDDVVYFLSAYQSPYQPTYFLVNGSTSVQSTPVICAKIAYENGGGYTTYGPPSVTVSGVSASVSYLFKDLIEAANKDTNVPSGTQTAGIYSQFGINMATFTFGTTNLNTSEIANNFHLSGGFLGMYDGFLPVEHNFFLWPDSVELTLLADPTPTGNVSNSVTPTVITSVSDVTGIVPGMSISGTGIPGGTTVVSVGTTTVTMSAPAASAHTGITITFTGNLDTQKYFYQLVYEWSDNQGNQFRSAPSIPVSITTTGGHSSIIISVPTLRLTMKSVNALKITIYRWSTAQQIYYQTTSISTPLLNQLTVDYRQYTDVHSDATILGNNIIYTTGGVVEDVNGPASNLLALFDSRLWLVDAENPETLWYSKQVIASTPVEMSDLFTTYIPPTVATQQVTGPITSITPMDDKLIIGKGGNAFVYINGAGPDNTGANNQYSQAIFITSTVGCSNQKSIVLMPSGMMFQSNKGIWLLDRSLGTSYIGAPVEDFTSGATVLSAVTVPETNQVRFTLDTGITLMYDYYYNQWGVFEGVPCVSSCIFQEMHTFINDSGNAYQEQENYYLDGGNPVLIGFKTGPLRLGDLQNYQRAYFFYLLGTYISPHKLQLYVTYDYDVNPSQSILINPTNYSTPYGSGLSQSPYGQGDPFGGPKNLEMWRVFLERQRCMAFSIELQEIFDASLGTNAGAGLTLSGLNVVMGFKKGFRPQEASATAG